MFAGRPDPPTRSRLRKAQRSALGDPSIPTAASASKSWNWNAERNHSRVSRHPLAFRASSLAGGALDMVQEAPTLARRACTSARRARTAEHHRAHASGGL